MIAHEDLVTGEAAGDRAFEQRQCLRGVAEPRIASREVVQGFATEPPGACCSSTTGPATSGIRDSGSGAGTPDEPDRPGCPLGRRALSLLPGLQGC